MASLKQVQFVASVNGVQLGEFASVTIPTNVFDSRWFLEFLGQVLRKWMVVLLFVKLCGNT